MNWIEKANKQLEEQRAAYQESLDSGEAQKRMRSELAKNRGLIGGSKGGKITSSRPEHKEFMQSIQKVGCSVGGKTGASGKSQVESGKIKDFQKAGNKAATDKFNSLNKTPEERKEAMRHMWETGSKKAKEKREKAAQKFYDSIKLEEFTQKDVMEYSSGYSKQMIRIFLKDTTRYMYLRKVNGNNKLYKKK